MKYDNPTDDNELWYKDGIIYQVHVKAYRDSNNDGIGDLKGITEKLDYIKSLGINILWLLPFYPSPLKDDGYDISDYFNVNPEYGNLEDFKNLLKQAHKRGIKVITELVLNHTSDQHKWFQLSRRSAPGSSQRNYYVWSDTPDKYQDARIIFSDFETSNWSWDPVAKSYFWHRFYSHQPDLNFENPEVHDFLYKAVDFWFELGVDGLRLDAVPYLYEKEGTNCENLPETHGFLKKLNKHINTKFKNRMLLAEANQWPEDAVAYFGDGDECQMAFHFPLMPRMYMAIQMETRFPIIDILEQTPAIPENCQWAMFLRNHDELTLEMVTDEERDYMYRFYAQDKRARINLGIRRRLAPLVDNNRRKIELLNILLFSFPGTPIVYYGDEIGMGDNYYLGDRNGVRTPMQWSPDRNAGFSDSNPQRLFLPVIIDPEYNFEAVNVEVQQQNSSSLLWWMKRAISVRKNYRAFGRGTIEFLRPNNTKVLSFYRKYEDETILVVANLSRFSQVVELDLSQYSGYTPIEIFSRNKFPIIKDTYYMLTLNAFDYYWFLFSKHEEEGFTGEKIEIPEYSLNDDLDVILTSEDRKIFQEKILINYLLYAPILEPGENKIDNIEIADIFKISTGTSSIVIRINYIDKPFELYLLFIGMTAEEKAVRVLNENKNAVLSYIKNNRENLIIFNAIYDENFRKDLLVLLSKKKAIKGISGELFLTRFKNYTGLAPKVKEIIHSDLRIDSNSFNIFYEDKIVVKLYKRLEPGINPGGEILIFLHEKTSYKNIPPLIGSLTYNVAGLDTITAGIVTENVANQGTAWNYFVDAADHYFEKILSRNEDELKRMEKITSLFPDDVETASSFLKSEETIYFENTKLLGKRTGELHNALASSEDDTVFRPESFNVYYNRSVYQAIRSDIKTAMRLLEKNMSDFNDDLKASGKTLLLVETKLISYIEKILKKKITAKKIRIHGDYHLGHVLFTGKDFIITSFEGPASTALSERKLKRSCLRDIASMMYSLQFASYSSFMKYIATRSQDVNLLEPFAEQWWLGMSKIFMNSYNEAIKGSKILPDDETELEYLTNIYLIDKMMIELSNNIRNNKEKILIPLKGLLYLSRYL